MIKNEMELVFLMVPRDSRKRFIGKPSNTVKPVLPEKPCIYSNVQDSIFFAKVCN